MRHRWLKGYSTGAAHCSFSFVTDIIVLVSCADQVSAMDNHKALKTNLLIKLY